MISYIFYIGIIYIVFSLIWMFFQLILGALVIQSAANYWQTFVIKIVKTYFLISILAIYTITFMHDPHHSSPLIATVGLLTLYSYLIGSLQRKQLIIQINNRMGNFGNKDNTDMRLEMLLVAAGLIYFTICLFYQYLPYNKINNWFYHAVHDIYDTPVIGWIIGFFGILFLLGVLVKAVLVTLSFLQRITGSNNNNQNRGNNQKNNDDYADYEIID